MVFTSEEWIALPLSFRVRWWRETDYGARDPFPELMTAARKLLAAR